VLVLEDPLEVEHNSAFPEAQVIIFKLRILWATDSSSSGDPHFMRKNKKIKTNRFEIYLPLS
jgi:hypothetical protein